MVQRASVTRGLPFALLSASSALSFACSKDITDPPDPEPQEAVAAVLVSPTSVSLVEGGVAQLGAQTLGATGNVLTGRSVGWESQDTLVARVSQTGLVSTVAPGQTSVVASSEGKSGSVSVSVIARIESIAISAPESVLTLGEETQLDAVLLDPRGNVITGREVSWETSNPASTRGSTTTSTRRAESILDTTTRKRSSWR